MKRRLAILAIALTALTFAACQYQASGSDDCCEKAAVVSHIDELTALMTGSFGSQAQAAADESFFDIRLQMARIWSERTDATWIYVEQAAGSSLDAPYRQRVYRVRHVGADLFESQVFSLEDPKAAIGAFAKPEFWTAIAPESLSERKGCAIILRRMGDDHYEGSTLGRACESALRGSTFATAEAVIKPEGMTTWDRGFDDAGEQVWGAVKGPYRFDRLQPSEPAPDTVPDAAPAEATEAAE